MAKDLTRAGRRIRRRKEQLASAQLSAHNGRRLLLAEVEIIYPPVWRSAFLPKLPILLNFSRSRLRGCASQFDGTFNFPLRLNDRRSLPSSPLACRRDPAGVGGLALKQPPIDSTGPRSQGSMGALLGDDAAIKH